jgi:RNA polymerase sigma factor (sigma-70 family)
MPLTQIEETRLMTSEYFSNAYQRGFTSTVRFLISRGVAYDSAFDAAQAAWAKGWERRGQLREPKLLITWVNTIALNIYRNLLRRSNQHEPLLDLEGPSGVNAAAIDAKHILAGCKPKDRIVLEDRYLRGYKIQEIADAHGWSERAVRVRLLRARRRAKERLNLPKGTRSNLSERTRASFAAWEDSDERAA